MPNTCPCKIWKLLPNADDNSIPDYPEAGYLGSRAETGVAISGGGMRAMTLGLGWTRALHDLEILRDVGYISSNSGGSWFSSIFSYAPSMYTPDQLLGAYIPPSDLAQNEQENLCPFPEIANVIAETNFFEKVILHTATPGQGGDRDDWSLAVGDFFTKYGLNHDDFVPVVKDQSCNVPPDFNQDFNLSSNPFPIINATIVNVKDAIGKNKGNYPFEMTPIYCDIPVKVVTKKPRINLGGMLIETAGVNSQEITPAASIATSAVSVDGNPSCIVTSTMQPKIDMVLSAAHQAGLSSQAVAMGVLSKFPKLSKAMPQIPMWGLDEDKEISYTEVGVIDGAGSDNTGILSLLRRGVQTIVACVAELVALPKFNDSDPLPEAYYDESVSSFAAVAGLFAGSGYKPSYGGASQKFRQVFNDKNGFLKICKDLRDCMLAGKASRSLYVGTVQPNTLIGVRGSYDVKILFVVNSMPQNWQSEATKMQFTRCTRSQKIHRSLGGNADMCSFPFYPTEYLNYGPVAVNTLSQLASWQIRDCAAELADMGLLPRGKKRDRDS